MIPAVEVSNLSHRLGVSDRATEKDHVPKWALVAIRVSELRGELAVKVGTGLETCQHPTYRLNLTGRLPSAEPVTSRAQRCCWTMCAR